MFHGERPPAATADVLPVLRSATAEQHARVEAVLDLLDPQLTAARLGWALGRLHAFWLAAESGLDAWARREPAAAAALGWPRRRRAHLFAADLTALHLRPEPTRPALPAVVDGDDAVGRLYVLEGATLGGRLIDRRLAGLPDLAAVRLRCFAPYGDRTGSMWRAFRAAANRRAAAGGDVDRMVTAAVESFAALAEWCRAGELPAPAAAARRGAGRCGDERRGDELRGGGRRGGARCGAGR